MVLRLYCLALCTPEIASLVPESIFGHVVVVFPTGALHSKSLRAGRCRKHQYRNDLHPLSTLQIKDLRNVHDDITQRAVLELRYGDLSRDAERSSALCDSNIRLTSICLVQSVWFVPGSVGWNLLDSERKEHCSPTPNVGS